jgi:hypothetical protein
MHETLQERIDSRGLSIRTDRELGILKGVKILGLESRNGRRYLVEALRGAAPLYEGAKVNVNHPKGSPGAPRDYQDRIGVIRNVTLAENKGLFADFHFNPQHALAGQLAWDAEHAPENVGFSHNVQARVSRQGDQAVVEQILKVHSVDLVADPATTRGLFEQGGSTGGGESTSRIAINDATLDDLRSTRADLVDALLAESRGTIERLEAEVQQLRQTEQRSRHRDLCRRVLAEYRLPDLDVADPSARELLGESFINELLASGSEDVVRRLVAGRARLIESARLWTAGERANSRPVARPQQAVESSLTPVTDGLSFARAILAR